MRVSPLFRTALFRLSLLHVAVFLSSALILAIGGSFLLSLILEREFREEIATEIDSLAALTPLERIADEIRKREKDGGHHKFHYLLQSPERQVIAGNLRAMSPVQGWTRVVTSKGDADEPEISNGRLLSDGSFLLVTRDSESLYESQDFIFQMLGWGLGLALPLAIAGGIATSFATLRRIETINRATIKIRRGDMKERVPVSDVDDEFNRLAQNINAMLDGKEELTEGIRQVTNDIAHDLRTPLSRLRQDLERAQQEPQAQTHGALIERSIASIDEVLDTFSSLLRISQIESGSGQMRFSVLDLSSLFRELADTFATVAEESGKALHCTVLDGVQFRGDKTLLKQMIVNLIENSIQHTPAGTAISVELGRDQLGVYATIADTGPGVPEWAREKIFRRFFRLDESRGSRGNGLGLSLVAAIAKHHGVTLTLSDNSPGLRTVLRFPDSVGAGAPMVPSRSPGLDLQPRRAG